MRWSPRPFSPGAGAAARRWATEASAVNTLAVRASATTSGFTAVPHSEPVATGETSESASMRASLPLPTRCARDRFPGPTAGAVVGAEGGAGTADRPSGLVIVPGDSEEQGRTRAGSIGARGVSQRSDHLQGDIVRLFQTHLGKPLRFVEGPVRRGTTLSTTLPFLWFKRLTVDWTIGITRGGRELRRRTEGIPDLRNIGSMPPS
jgi:hypothetical protein